jgi:hypothetical protein
MRCKEWSDVLAAQCDLEEGHKELHNSAGDCFYERRVKPVQVVPVAEGARVTHPKVIICEGRNHATAEEASACPGGCSYSEPHEIHSFICRRCEVAGLPHLFHGLEVAEEHALYVHPQRLLVEYQDLAQMRADPIGPGSRTSRIRHMLRNHNAEKDTE